MKLDTTAIAMALLISACSGDEFQPGPSDAGVAGSSAGGTGAAGAAQGGSWQGGASGQGGSSQGGSSGQGGEAGSGTFSAVSTDTTTAMAIDDQWVYYVTKESASRLRKVELSTNNVVDLATKLSAPIAVGVDANRAYWLSSTTRRVWAVNNK